MSQSKQIAIAVLGATGSGKSSFINTVVGPRTPATAAPADVGHGLKSQTIEINPVPAVVDAHECILVDTPGYDDTTRSDVEILRATADFFQICFQENHLLSGIVYLHRITDNRIGGVAAKNFRMLAKLCGPTALRNVVLCTTMWDAVEPALGEERETELRAEFWQPMIAAGATVMRHDGTEASALAIVRRLVGMPPAVLQLQDELVNRKMTLSETAAGQEVGAELARLMDAHKLEIGHLRRELEGAQERDGREVREELAREQEALRARESELALLLRSREQEVQELTRRVGEHRSGGFWGFIKELLPLFQLLPALLGGGSGRRGRRGRMIQQ